MINLRTDNLDLNIVKATIEYIKLKERMIHPDGQFDNAQRWYPTDEQSCCSRIRQPTRSYPYSLMTHCRTKLHVANCYNISEEDISCMLKKSNLTKLFGFDTYIDKYITSKLGTK
ncbi:MAG: hypothetical protein M0R17_03075 [Candidatus Omnitrophica bacterium]|jgi:hypothetical protein|nr:hypothetical protein [Candidatus Omnitrophota bacterium]